MKKNVFFRLSALVLTVLMTIGLFAFVSFADEEKGDQVWDDEYTDTYYKSGENCGYLTFELDGARIGDMLTGLEFDKESVMAFIPAMLREIINTRSKQSVIDFLCDLVDKGFLTYDNMLNLFNGKEEVMDKYIDRDIWSRTLGSSKIRSAGGTKVNNALRAFFTGVLLNEVNEMKINDTVIYVGDNDDASIAFTFDHNAVQTALFKALPDAATVANAKDGDELLNLHFTSTGDNVNFDVTMSFVVKGDCKKLNHCADKFVDVMTYTVEDDGAINFEFTFDKDYTDAYSDLLATDKLTDARKLELLGMYTKDGAALTEDIKAETKEEIELINSTLGHRTGRGGDRTYPDSYFETLKAFIVKMAENSDSVAGFASIDHNYVGDGVFVFDMHESVPFDAIVEKINEQVDVPEEALMYIRHDDHRLNGTITVKTTDFYRVRFHDTDDNVIYLTYLPAGESLDFIVNNETSLAGHGENGWYDEYGTLTTDMPGRDVELYETFETVDIDVTKVWVDDDNQDGKRPNEIVIGVFVGDKLVDQIKLVDYPFGVVEGEELTEKMDTAQISEDGNTWTYTITGLPKYVNGEEADYTIDEIEVPEGYQKTVNGTTITNTYSSEKVDVTVTKVWVDENNKAGKRPNVVTVTLYADGEPVETVIISGLPVEAGEGADLPKNLVLADVSEDGNTWTYTFEQLAKFANGEEIVYTVDEDEVPEGYEKTVDGTTVTNTYKVTPPAGQNFTWIALAAVSMIAGAACTVLFVRKRRAN